MKDFKLLPGMKVCIKRTANRCFDNSALSISVGFNNTKGNQITLMNSPYNYTMSCQLGLYGKITSTKEIKTFNDTLLEIGKNRHPTESKGWFWLIQCIDKSKSIIDLDGKKVYVQKRNLVV